MLVARPITVFDNYAHDHIRCVSNDAPIGCS